MITFLYCIIHLNICFTGGKVCWTSASGEQVCKKVIANNPNNSNSLTFKALN